MTQDAAPPDNDTAARRRWSWSRADRVLMIVVIVSGLLYAVWEARHELFGIARPGVTLNAAAGGSAQPTSTALDYARLIHDENFHVLLGVAYANAGMFDQAIVHEREALRVNPASVPALSNLGYYLYLKGNYPESAATLERALTLDSRSDLVRNNLHLTYAKAIETATSDEERRRWQARRLALAAGSVPGPAAK